MPKFDAQDRGLQFIETAVHARLIAHVPFPPTVFTQPARALRQFRVIRGYRPTVAESAEVLGRIKAECRHVAPRAGFAAPDSGPVRLGAIFDYAQPVASGNFHHDRHVGGMSVQVDRNDRLERGAGVGADGFFERVAVHRERDRVDIHQHGYRPGQLHRGHGRDSRMRHRDHGVSRPYAARPQRQLQRVGAAADTDDTGHSQIRGELALECVHFLAQDVPSTVQHGGDRCVGSVCGMRTASASVIVTDQDNSWAPRDDLPAMISPR